MSKLEEINNKIEANKEILSTLPKNNPKNINKYIKTVTDLKEEFEEYQKLILNEMTSRFEALNDIKKNPDIDLIEQEIIKAKDTLYLLNELNTSFEKMNFDRFTYDLRYYYKNNLEVVSNAIFYCIKKFKETGNKLELEDFCYSQYVRDYLEVFFEELNNPNIDYTKIKSKFEEIYWECSNIITYIELNIRNLYFQKEKNIDKYYSKKKKELLDESSKENRVDKYMELKKQIVEKINEDKAIIIQSFFEGRLNAKDFTPQAIDERYSKFISKEILENADLNMRNEINSNIKQLANSVYEYKNYLNYKFIIDDVVKIYSQKEQYKNTFLQIKKDIENEEKKIIKLYNKSVKKADESLANEQNNLILKVKEMYRELEKNKIYYQIAIKLKDESTIIDVLHLASSFYGYVSDCMINFNKEASKEEVEATVHNLREFVIYPYNTILSNISMSENKDLLLMIKDRYKLLGINITKEDLEAENLDTLMLTIKNIEIGYNIRKNEINVEDLKYICEFKKILNR